LNWRIFGWYECAGRGAGEIKISANSGGVKGTVYFR